MIHFDFVDYGNGRRLIILDGLKKIGAIGLGVGNRPGYFALGYDLLQEYQKRGIMTKALKLFIAKSGYKAFQACVYGDNIGSQTVLKRNGFKEVGRNNLGRGILYFTLDVK